MGIIEVAGIQQEVELIVIEKPFVYIQHSEKFVTVVCLDSERGGGQI